MPLTGGLRLNDMGDDAIIEIEAWRDIPGWEGMYCASTFGRIKSIRLKEEKIIRGGFVIGKSINNKYRHTYFMVNGKSYGYMTHALIALTFLGERPEGYQVNHKDGDKMNNRPGNLEYLTPSENKLHACETGLFKGKYISTQEAELIRGYYDGPTSTTRISKIIGCSTTTVRNVVHKRKRFAVK